MSKLLQELIKQENAKRGLKHYQIGAYTTYTRGFGRADDMQIGQVVNANGGVIGCCRANVNSFREHLASQQRVDGSHIHCYESPKGKNVAWDRWTVVYLEIPARNVNGQLYRECVGMSGHSECMMGKHLGKLVMFDVLPETLQAVVRADIAEIVSKRVKA